MDCRGGASAWRRARWALVLCLSVGQVLAAGATPAAAQLFKTIDALEVESHWPAGVHVNWLTGEPDGRLEKTEGKHTHCSAFVAAAAKQVGIYILRPPEHGQVLLANAQYDWLGAEGKDKGWKPVADGAEAQRLANLGWFVVATYRNHKDDKPGHIAIVRPSDKSAAALAEDGPEITQAGGTNYRSTTVRKGFSGHPAAWKNREVRYFAHAVSG